jgi:hypothetical protein
LPNPNKTKATVTISIDPVKWKLFQALSKEKLAMKASPHVERLVETAIAQMQGKEPSFTLNLDDLRKQHTALQKSADDALKILEAHGVRDDFSLLLKSYGLEPEPYANAAEVIPKLVELQMQKGPLKNVSYSRSDIGFCLDWLESIKKLGEVNAKLLSLRAKIHLQKQPETSENELSQA